MNHHHTSAQVWQDEFSADLTLLPAHPHVHSQSAHRPPVKVPETNRKTPLKCTIYYLSQFKEDRGEPSVSAQEINAIKTYCKQITQLGTKYRSRNCPSKYAYTVTTRLQGRTYSAVAFSDFYCQTVANHFFVE